tara:strand:- start:64789 stop:66270 length:1482 start_codon:yes stop_codon:yes gene_type:complete
MISVIYCTKKSTHEHKSHIAKTSGLGNKIEVIEIVNNGEDLTKAYNRGLKQATNDIVVFCHDDIMFNKNGWGRKLVKHFEDTDYGILGIAGTTDLPETGKWWTDTTKMVGGVKHSHEGKTWLNQYSGNFNDKIIETTIVDGLFFAIHKDRIKLKFNTKVKGFHFYEIDFCFRNKLKGVKIGVVSDIKVTHKSIGITNDDWEANRLNFIETYKDDLPFNIDVTPFIDEISTTYVTTPKVKIIVTSNGKKKRLKKLIKQIENLEYPNQTIDVIVEGKDFEKINKLELDNVTIHEGMYDSLTKNLSVLRWDEDFISSEDELVLFISDNINLRNNILSNFVRAYTKNKKNFGAIFPRTLNENKTILSCGTEIFVVNQDEKQIVDYMFKGMNSYFKYIEGIQNEPMGGIGLCFMTSFANLEKYGWFKLDLEKGFYESAYSLMCSNDNKRVLVDNDSVVQLKDSFFKKDNPQLNQDFKNFMNVFKENQRLHKYLKIVKQ